MDATSVSPAFGFEVIKLLMQAAWADLEIQPEEARLIGGWVDALGLMAHDRETVRACLAGEQRLPPPDLGLLRVHRENVLSLVHQLLAADRALDRDEQQVLDEIVELLG